MTVKRQPQGTPVGGQFASHVRTDSGVQLDGESAETSMSPAAFAEMLHGKGFELGEARGLAAAATVIDTARTLLATAREHQQKRRFPEAAIYTIAFSSLDGVQGKLWGDGTAAEGRIAAIADARSALDKALGMLRYAESVDTFARNLDGILAELEEMLRAE